MLEDSPLGVVTDIGDFSRNMNWIGQKTSRIDKTYTQNKIKKSEIHYQANELICTFANADKQEIDVVFRVSNNDIAFRYVIPERRQEVVWWKEKRRVLIFRHIRLLFCVRKVMP